MEVRNEGEKRLRGGANRAIPGRTCPIANLNRKH
jgi:hypothetical protein